MGRPGALLDRADSFCRAHGLRTPVLLAPMAGACPPSLSIAVAQAGGLGACGALLLAPQAIRSWAEEVRGQTDGPFQLNLWIPGSPPHRDPDAERVLRSFLGEWGPAVAEEAGDVTLPDFDAQCEAMLEVRPAIISSVMGLYPRAFVERMKERGITWFATVTTVGEARAAEEAGADVVVAQGMEAGGHRGAFDPAQAEASMAGLLSLVPAVADAVDIPVVATGGIADARGVAAALILGASAVQVGTGFLRTPEAQLPAVWAEAIGRASPEETAVTRAFSGRSGRSIANAYVRAAAAPDAPAPAPYPVQRGLTGAMRKAATHEGDIERMQAWAGQSARLAQDRPAKELAEQLWSEAKALLSSGGHRQDRTGTGGR